MASMRQANCFGYAVKRNEWLVFEAEYSRYPALLEEKFNLKPVRRKNMVLGKEYVAFRYSRPGFRERDFHFMRRNKLGHWRHKVGNLKPVRVSEKTVFSGAWVTPWYSYDSRIYLFEVR